MLIHCSFVHPLNTFYLKQLKEKIQNHSNKSKSLKETMTVSNAFYFINFGSLIQGSVSKTKIQKKLLNQTNR